MSESSSKDELSVDKFEAALAKEEQTQLELADNPEAAERRAIERCVKSGDAEDLIAFGAEALGKFESKSARLTPLLLCMQHKRWDVAEKLMESIPEQAQKRSELFAWHPLHYAAGGAPGVFVEKVLKLSGSGADPVNSNEMTPLGVAASHGNLDALAVLIKAGGNVEGSQKGERPMVLAALSNQPEALEVLAKAGADVNGKGLGGQTPLMAAAEKNCSEALQKLLELGADASLKDALGRTALDIAQSEKSKETTKLLGGGKKPKEAKAPKAAEKKPTAKAKPLAEKTTAPKKKPAAKTKKAAPKAKKAAPSAKKPSA